MAQPERWGTPAGFGWKASVASLREATLQACSSELGLEVPGFAARGMPPWKSDYKASGIDLTREQCDTLSDFVASLPRPGVASCSDSKEQAGSIDLPLTPVVRQRRSYGRSATGRNSVTWTAFTAIFCSMDMGRWLSDSGCSGEIVLETADCLQGDKSIANLGAANAELEWAHAAAVGPDATSGCLTCIDGSRATVADAVAPSRWRGNGCASKRTKAAYLRRSVDRSSSAYSCKRSPRANDGTVG